MTMMSSLKAFLFASPAQGAMIGAAAVPSAGGEGGDFAALLGGIAQTPAVSGPGGALPIPNPASPVPTEGEARALPVDMQAPPPVDPLAMPPGNMLPVETPAPAIVVTKAPILMEQPAPAIAEAEGDAPPSEADDDADQPKADTSATIVIAPATIAPPIALPPAVPVPVLEALSVASPETKPLIAVALSRQRVEGVPVKSPSSSVDGVRLSPEAVDPSSSQTARQAAASQQVLPQDEMPATTITRPAGNGAASSQEIVTDRPIVASQAFPTPASPIAPAIVQPVQATLSISNAAAVAGQAVSTIAFRGGTPDPALSLSRDISVVDSAIPTVLPVPNAPAPVKSEALSLLQLVREHFVRREGGASTEAASPVAASGTADPVVADSAPAATLATLAPIPVIASASTPATGPIQAMPAAVDLGGTIAGQVVDMGVQGQWIDGLAKDIASLSTNGAQGRFQIRSDHLGAVQVDIRPSVTGTTVSLTVASDAAQQALQADGDRLIADAVLSAMKITDLRVERGTISEAQRSDSTGQQNSQSQSQNQAQNGSQAMGQGQGQGLSQGMGQNRSGQRDNFSGNHKAGPDSAVLQQADSREGEATGARRAASRARYA